MHYRVGPAPFGGLGLTLTIAACVVVALNDLRCGITL